MTVGEKIQYYRKKNGLSQEELGFKLLVSRQTVSLWEMDKTTPTVDNLLRLKEIFGVSLDNMLSEEILNEDTSLQNADWELKEEKIEDKTEEKKESGVKPKESYRQRLSLEEYNNVNGAILQSYWKKNLLAIIASVCLLALGILSRVTVMIYVFAILGALYLFVLFANHFKFRSESKKNTQTVIDTVYEFKVYDGYFTVSYNNVENGEIRKFFKILPDEIRRVEDLGDYYGISYNGTLVVKKELIATDSFFHRIFVEKKQSKKLFTATGEKPDALSAVSIVLIALSAISVWIPLIIAGIVSRDASLDNEMWIFGVFAVIPLASVIYSFVLRKNKRRFMGNLILGVIMTALLLGFSFTYQPYDEWVAPVTRAEEITGISLPTPYDINTTEYTTERQPAADKGYVHYVTKVEFTDKDASDFERQLEFQSVWMERIPASMTGIKPPYPNVSLSNDYFYIYNLTTKKANTLPNTNGEYEFLALSYNAHENLLIITEYRVNYTR